MAADHMHFQGKTGPFFPFRNPLYFSVILPFLGIPEVPDDLLDSQFFTLKEMPLNMPVFFRLKRPVSKNT